DISREGDGSAFPGLVADADPVRLHHYEIGTKWDLLDKRLSATAALFRTYKKNVPFNIAGMQYGEQIVQGHELDLTGHLRNDWQIYGGGLFKDIKRKYYAIIELVCNGTICNVMGLTPNYSAILWSTYRIPHTSRPIGGGLQYVGSSWVGRPDDANNIVKNG